MRTATPRNVHAKSAQIARDRRWREGLNRRGPLGTSPAEYARAASSRRAFRTDRRRFGSLQSPRCRPELSCGALAGAGSPAPAAILRGTQSPARTQENRQGKSLKNAARWRAPRLSRASQQRRRGQVQIRLHNRLGFPLRGPLAISLFRADPNSPAVCFRALHATISADQTLREVSNRLGVDSGYRRWVPLPAAARAF